MVGAARVEDHATAAAPCPLALNPEQWAPQIDHQVIRLTAAERQQDFVVPADECGQNGRLGGIASRRSPHL
jgi:hypothetical protein